MLSCSILARFQHPYLTRLIPSPLHVSVVREEYLLQHNANMFFCSCRRNTTTALSLFSLTDSSKTNTTSVLLQYDLESLIGKDETTSTVIFSLLLGYCNSSVCVLSRTNYCNLIISKMALRSLIYTCWITNMYEALLLPPNRGATRKVRQEKDEDSTPVVMQTRACSRKPQKETATKLSLRTASQLRSERR